MTAMREHHIPAPPSGISPGGREKEVFFGLASLSSLSYVTPET